VRRLLSAALVGAIASVVLVNCATAPDNILLACARGSPGPIEGEWALERIDGAAWSGSRATLLAEGGGFGGALACNSYSTSAPDEGGAHYGVADGRLIVSGFLVTTTAGCLPRERMALEAAFLGILESEPHVAHTGDDAICLYTDDGRSLEFRRVEGVDS